MTVEEANVTFSSYSPGEKAEFLAGLMYEITIVARDSYEVGGDGLINAERMRRLNEVQHCLSAFLWALLRNDARRYPDDILLEIVLGPSDDAALDRQLSAAFGRMAAQRLTAA
ncbi:MAG: hypothetical protein ACRD9R_23365 [Pyrinomonadaceae bacterium]